MVGDLLAAGVCCVQGFAFGAPAPAETWTAERLCRAQPYPRRRLGLRASPPRAWAGGLRREHRLVGPAGPWGR